MSPTVCINHYFGPANQQNRTKVLIPLFCANVFKQSPALKTNFFKGNVPNFLPTATTLRGRAAGQYLPLSRLAGLTALKPNYKLL